MSPKQNEDLIRAVFQAVEQRDGRRLLDLCCPDVAFHWPPSLPYGGQPQGLAGPGPSWNEIWDPLQPTEAERRMEPRVVAASDEEVVALWWQRGISPAGERFDGQVLGLYQVRDGRLARAQMFYFDTAPLISFLASAISGATVSKQAR